MDLPITSKISPLVSLTAQNMPVVPILVEGTPQTFYDVLSIFDTLQINIYQSIPTFGFVAGLANKDVIIDIAAQKEVLMVHPDTTNIGFSSPNPLSSPLDVFSYIKPFVEAPLSALNQDFGKKIFDSFMSQNALPVDPMSALPPFPPALPQLPQIPQMPFPFASQFKPPALAEKLKAKLEDQSFGYATEYTRKLLNIDKAEEIGITGKGVKVAVLDTGLDLTSAQVSGDVEYDNAMTGDAPLDSNGHGTHTFTTALGFGTINYRNIAVKGMAPDAHKIAIKVLGYVIGTGRDSDIMKGMEMAYQKGAHIVSMSLGSNQDVPQSPLCRAVTRLTQEGMIFAIAAGNSGDKPRTIGTPATAEAAITVGAVSPKDNTIAYFSSRGLTVDGRIKPDICVSADTILFSNPNGEPVTIQEYSVENKIFAIDPLTNKSVLAECISKHDNGIQDVFELRTKNHLIKTTKEHQFLTAKLIKTPYTTFKLSMHDKELILRSLEYANMTLRAFAEYLGMHEVSFQRILKGTRGTTRSVLDAIERKLTIGIEGIEFDNRFKWDYKFEWSELQYLSIGDLVLIAKPNLIEEKYRLPVILEKETYYKNKLATIPEYMNDALAWLSGLFLGDGHLIKNDHYKEGVAGINWYVYDEIREKCKDLLIKTFNLEIHEYENWITISSVEVAELFKSLGLTGNAHTKRIPVWAFSLPKDERIQLLYGLRDSDGYSLDETHWRIELANELLINDIKYLAESVGFSTSNIYKRTRITNSLIKLNSEEYEPKPSTTFSITIAENPIHNSDPNIFRLQEFLELGELRAEKITKIEYVGKEQVYDLTIDSLHNYIANGFVVHNCSYGVDIYSATSFGSLLDSEGDKRVDGYSKLSGTSMATPHMAGLLALVKQAYPDATADTIKQVFANKGLQQKNPIYGWGVANWNWFASGLRQ